MVLKIHRDVNGEYASLKQSIHVSLIQLEEKKMQYSSEYVQCFLSCAHTLGVENLLCMYTYSVPTCACFVLGSNTMSLLSPKNQLSRRTRGHYLLV